jgi:hypothetical protein
MEKKTKEKEWLTLILIYFSIAIVLVSCGKKRSDWKGTIKKGNGVTIVKNPKEPMYRKDVFSLEKELVIGEEKKADEYLFSQIADVGVDHEENIYILDVKDAHILVFNKNGEYLRTIGKRGQGPGEFQHATNLTITPGNEILVNDRGARFLHFYALNGDYLRSLSFASMPSFHRPKVDSQGNIVARHMFIDKTAVFVLAKFDARLNLIFTIFSYEISVNPGLLNLFAPDCFWEICNDDTIVWGYSAKYEFEVLDRAGRMIRKITKDYDPVEITKEEKQKWVMDTYGKDGIPPNEKVTWSKNHHAFQFMKMDDAGRIFVQTYEKKSEAAGFFLDVFDSEGKYLGKAPLKTRPFVFKRGKLYSVEEDKEGLPLVIRYKVKWNF